MYLPQVQPPTVPARVAIDLVRRDRQNSLAAEDLFGRAPHGVAVDSSLEVQRLARRRFTMKLAGVDPQRRVEALLFVVFACREDGEGRRP